MEPPEQGTAHRERDLVITPLRLWTGPHRGLLRCDRGCGCRRNRRVAQEILLVARGLELKTRQQGIVSPHPSGGTVLNGEAGVTIKDPVHPVKESPVVSQHPYAGADVPGLGPWPDIDVVVHLEIPDAQVSCEEVDYLVEMSYSRRV